MNHVREPTRDPDQLEVVAIIPARGGSKRLPNKNIRLLAGKPLIVYSIEHALAAEVVDRVVVTTDSEHIAAISRDAGAEVRFMRPSELATDSALMVNAIVHALTWLDENEDYRPDIVVALPPTAPVRRSGIVDEGVRLLISDPSAGSVKTIVPLDNRLHHMFVIKDGNVEPLLGPGWARGPLIGSTQNVPTAYLATNDLVAAWRPVLVDPEQHEGDRILPIVLDKRSTVDIDTLEDLRRAELILERHSVRLVDDDQE